MDLWQLLLDSRVIANLVWAGIVISVVLLFRKQIGNLIDRIKEAEAFGAKVKTEFPQIPSPKEIESVSGLQFAYYLGRILSELWFLSEFGVAKRNEIINNLSDAIIYARKLGLDKDASGLEDLQIKLIGMDDRTPVYIRAYVSARLTNILYRLGVHLEAKEKGMPK